MPLELFNCPYEITHMRIIPYYYVFHVSNVWVSHPTQIILYKSIPKVKALLDDTNNSMKRTVRAITPFLKSAF